MVFVINIGVSEYKQSVLKNEYINLSAKNEVKIVDTLLDKFKVQNVFIDSVHLTYIDGSNSQNKLTIQNIFGKYSEYYEPTHFVIFMHGYGNIQSDGTRTWYSWKVDGAGDADSYIEGKELIALCEPLLEKACVTIISNTCHFESEIVFENGNQSNFNFDDIQDLFAYQYSNHFNFTEGQSMAMALTKNYPQAYSHFRNCLTLFAFSQKNVWVNFNETRTYSGLFLEMLINLNFDYSPNNIYELSWILLNKYNNHKGSIFYPRLCIYHSKAFATAFIIRYLNTAIPLSMPR